MGRIEGKAGTSVPNKSVESMAQGSSAVKTYRMSPEELEDYRARNGYKAPTNDNGERIKPPVEPSPSSYTPEKQAERARKSHLGRKPIEGPPKADMLRLVAEGRSISSIERDWGMKPSSLHYWIKKWDLVGITPGKARELLGQEQQAEPDPQEEAQEPETHQAEEETFMQVTEERKEDMEGELAKIVEEQDNLIGQLRTDYAAECAAHNEHVSELVKLERDNRRLTDEAETWRKNMAASIVSEFTGSGRLTITIPLIDVGDSPIEQRKKVYEEFEEFGAEIDDENLNMNRAASELYDLNQIFFGLLYAKLKELHPEEDVIPYVKRFNEYHTRKHAAKIDRYAMERGWVMLE